MCKESEKKFDKAKFAFDLYNYRNNLLRISRLELSTRIGISPHIINQAENCKSIPNLEDAYKMCVLMGTNIYDYFN